MSNSNLVRDHRNTISGLIFALCSFRIIGAVDTNSTTSTSASTSSCTPLDCVPVCTPNCGIQEACVLRTMTNCAVCPPSQCYNRATLGLPPAASSSVTNQSSPQDSSNSSGLIGGIVGGLAGLGILIGIGVYCYIKRAKKKRKLPFAFTDGGMGIMSQEKFQSNPSLAATLTQHQNRSVVQTSIIEPRKYISLSELANNYSTTSANSSALQLNTNRSINNPIVSPISNTNNNSYINNQTSSVYDVSVNNNDNSQAFYHDNNDNQTISTPNTDSFNFNDNNLMASPVIGNPVVPEEFEEKIALQNKRISQILSSNPRLSRGSLLTQTPLPVIENRMSGISFTTDDDSEYDGDNTSVSSYNPQPQQAVVQSRSPYQPQLATQAVQVTRAKAQIMRVNSVRSNSGGGLGRSESVRTVLTAVNTPPTLPQIDLSDDNLFTDSFPATPNNRSFTTIEDPFLDSVNDTKQ